MKRIILAFLICLIFLVGCRQGEICFKDEDCIVTGCSSEICANKPLPSVCVWKPEYDCLKHSKCKCIGFRCQWENTTKYYECLKSIENKTLKIS
jgi:eight-cysteine-cluster-containing protein